MSLGDSHGDRRDFYRYLKQVKRYLNKIPYSEKLNLAYIKFMETQNQVLLDTCGDIVYRANVGSIDAGSLTEVESTCIRILSEMKYIEVEDGMKINFIVPIFTVEDMQIINEINKLVMDAVVGEIKSSFESIGDQLLKMSAVQHGIDSKEIATELWHHVFGKTNEILGDLGLFVKPEYLENEGRYHRAIFLLE